MADFQTLIADVRTEIVEPTAGFWGDAEIKRWLNEAHAFVTRKLKVEAAPSTITTTDGTEFYALPSDFGETRRVELRDKDNPNSYVRLLHGSLEDRIPSDLTSLQQGKGKPHTFFVYNEKLYLIPAPDGQYTVNLFYYKRANTLTNNADIPNVPYEAIRLLYERALHVYAVSQAKGKEENPGYQKYVGDFDALVRQLVIDARNRGSGGRFRQIREV